MKIFATDIQSKIISVKAVLEYLLPTISVLEGLIKKGDKDEEILGDSLVTLLRILGSRFYKEGKGIEVLDISTE